MGNPTFFTQICTYISYICVFKYVSKIILEIEILGGKTGF